MTYEDILELLPDFVRGTLDAETAALVEAQVSDSSSLQKEVESLRAYYESLESLDDISAPGDFVDRVNQGIEGRKGLAGLLHGLFFPLHVKLPLEAIGLGVTVLLVIMVFNPMTLKNAPDEVTGKARPTALRQAPAPEDEVEWEDVDELAQQEALEEKKALAEATPQPQPGHGETAGEPEDPSARGAALASSSAPEPSVRSGAGAAAGGVGESDDLKAEGFAEPMPRDEDESLAMAPSPRPEPAPAAKTAKRQAQPKPKAAPPPSASAEARVAMDQAAAEEKELGLARRTLKSEREALSVLALVVNDRDIDDSNVKGSRKARSRSKDGTAGTFMYESVAHKVWAIVERTIKNNSGAYRVRSTVLTPVPRREYTVTLPRSKFDTVRTQLGAVGEVRDIDLNLDASTASRVSLKLRVVVE